MDQSHQRHITFESVPNFRDLGGWRTHDGRTMAWRRLFRSAALHPMTGPEVAKFKQDIGPRAVIDLTTPQEPNKQREISLLGEMGARYYHIPFRPDTSNYLKEEAELNLNATNMGEIYLYRISQKAFGKKLVDALEIIAERSNHPLVFHCSIGKDRTGVLSAMLLATVDVIDEDIIEDYTLSAPLMPEIRSSTINNPETRQEVRDLPDFQWEATRESMSLFLNALRREYGSAAGYFETHGADISLTRRLKEALLV
jgi:protein-tyrosine phosphatase